MQVGKEGNSHGVRANGKGRLGPREADSRCGTGISVGLKRGRDEGRVRGGWSAAGSWEKKYEGGAEVEVEAALDLYLTLGSRALASKRPHTRRALGRPEDRGFRFPDLDPRFPVAESPTSIILLITKPRIQVG